MMMKFTLSVESDVCIAVVTRECACSVRHDSNMNRKENCFLRRKTQHTVAC